MTRIDETPKSSYKLRTYKQHKDGIFTIVNADNDCKPMKSSHRDNKRGFFLPQNEARW